VGFLSMLMLLSFHSVRGRGPRLVQQGLVAHPAALSYTLQHYERSSWRRRSTFSNSFLYSGLAVALCIVVGVPIAWVLAAPGCPGGRARLDQHAHLAVPGTAIASPTSAPSTSTAGFDSRLTSFWIIMADRARGATATLHRAGRPLSLCSSTDPWKRPPRAWAHGTADDPRHQPPLDLERTSWAASFPHDLAAGGVRRPLPGSRWVGDDHQRDLHLLYRGSSSERAALGAILIAVAGPQRPSHQQTGRGSMAAARLAAEGFVRTDIFRPSFEREINY